MFLSSKSNQMFDMAIPDTNTETTTTTTTASAGSKRSIDEIDYIYIEDDSDSDETKKDKDDVASVAKKNDEDDYDIFSEESKLQLSTRISKCRCGGFRICKPCFEIYKPTLVDTGSGSDSDNETDEKTDEKTAPETLTGTPQLCKRDCEDGSHCTDDYTSLPIFPCTVCKRMEDGGEVTTDWHLDCEQSELIICDEDMCPGCLGMIKDKVCKVCKYNCDI